VASSGTVDRSRSPRAPKHSLEEAVQYAKALYNAVHRSPISSTMAYELMGFQGKSGASSSALGSVRQFGLIEGTGEKTRVSDLALAILEPANQEERASAMAEAAGKPDVFQAIKSRFNDRVPTADEPIRAYLIRELGFMKGGADETIKSLRSTEQFVAASAPAKSELPILEADQKGPAESPKEELAYQSVQTGVPQLPHGNSPHDLMRVALTKDCYAELRFSGEISGRAISNLKKYIDLMGDVWADDETD